MRSLLRRGGAQIGRWAVLPRSSLRHHGRGPCAPTTWLSFRTAVSSPVYTADIDDWALKLPKYRAVWKRYRTKMPKACAPVKAVELDENLLLVVGGGEAWRLDTETMSWEGSRVQGPALPIRHVAVRLVDENTALVVGRRYTYPRSLLLDLQTWRTTPTPSLPKGKKRFHFLPSKDSYECVLASAHGWRSRKISYQRFNENTLGWDPVEDPGLLASLKEDSYTRMGDTVYRLHGGTLYTRPATSELHLWTSVSAIGDMPPSTGRPSLVPLCGKLVAFGGLTVGGLRFSTASTHVYDPATNIWTKLCVRAPHPPKRYWASMTALSDSEAMLMGGRTEWLAKDDMWHFELEVVEEGGDRTFGKDNKPIM